VEQSQNRCPKVSHFYQRKLRLLVTSACSHRCPFCHNEGLDRANRQTMSVEALSAYLPQLRDIGREISVSGGEPLQCPDIAELLALMAECDFDITLLTSGFELDRHFALLRYLSSIHVSLPSLDTSDPLSNCSGPVGHKLKYLPDLVHDFPDLALCISVPFVKPLEQVNQLSKYLELAASLKAKLKFIHEFSLARYNARAHSTTWVQRWGRLVSSLTTCGFYPGDISPREAEYLNDDGLRVELSEIACVATDQRYGSGVCFDNMDVTITPDLQVSLCRWQCNRRPLGSLFSTGIDSFIASLTVLMNKDVHGCPYGSPPHPLSSDQKLSEYVFREHNEWPAPLLGTGSSVASLVRQCEYSYYGKSGVVGRFEREFAEYHNVPFCLTTNSGTAALYLAYKALGFGPHTEVVVPIYSYPAVVTPLVALGVGVVFCDVEPTTGNIDIASLADVITERTRGVAITHMWGHPVDMGKLVALCRSHSLRIIEDCSHAFGARIGSWRVGSFGDVACFSLQANKLVCAGEGGALITAEREIYDAATVNGALKRRVVDTVRLPTYLRYWETGLGLKLKIHPLGAALALEYLHHADEMLAQRSEKAEIISKAIESTPGIFPPERPMDPVQRVYYTYKAILGEDLLTLRDAIVETLILGGLRIRRSDLRPLHLTKLFEELLEGNEGMIGESLKSQHDKGVKSTFPGAEAYYRRVISLPTFTNEPASLVGYYARTLDRAVRAFSGRRRDVLATNHR
jgi:perosamine synthetase